MPVTASSLRELHRIHCQISDLRGRLGRGPQRIRVAEANVALLDSQYDETKAAATRTRVMADEKELQLREREDRIKDLRIKLNACGSNREYQTLKEQIAADGQANSVQADEVLEAMERIDELQAAVTAIDEQRSKANEELGALRKSVAEEVAQLELELQRVSGDLASAEAGLPADFKQDYQRITKARGPEALAPISGETCSGCFQRLSAQTMDKLLRSIPVFCSSCGAVLYFPEERLPEASDL